MNAKPLKIDTQESPLSAEDLRCREYLELSEQIKTLTKRIETLKADFKHRGSFTSRHYVVSVVSQDVSEYVVKAHKRTLLNVAKKAV